MPYQGSGVLPRPVGGEAAYRQELLRKLEEDAGASRSVALNALDGDRLVGLAYGDGSQISPPSSSQASKSAVPRRNGLAQVLHGAGITWEGQVHVFASRKVGGADDIADKSFIKDNRW